jgi:hypothetical protein
MTSLNANELKPKSSSRPLHLFVDDDEFESFFNSVRTGTFYTDFIESLNLPNTPESRDKVKVIIFEVFFSKVTDISKWNDKEYIPYGVTKTLFKSIYPSVYNFILELKKDNYKDLAITLQKLESYIFIDVVAKNLVDAGIIPLTVHDCVIVKTSDVYLASDIIDRTFLDLFGNIPTFSIEQLNNKDGIL